MYLHCIPLGNIMQILPKSVQYNFSSKDIHVPLGLTIGAPALYSAASGVTKRHDVTFPLLM
jgi:hypothetical protein